MRRMEEGFEEFVQAFTGLDSSDDLDPESRHVFESTYYAGASHALFMVYHGCDFREAVQSMTQGDGKPMATMMATVMSRGKGLNIEIQARAQQLANAMDMEMHLH